MRNIGNRRGLRSILAAGIATGLLAASSSAFAAPVYLTCTSDGAPTYFKRYITIDYAANTVVSSGLNVMAPDGEIQKVQIGNSEITWQVVGQPRADGNYYAEHYTLNRLSGVLSYYDDGTQHGEAWTCVAGTKPAPKF